MRIVLKIDDALLLLKEGTTVEDVSKVIDGAVTCGKRYSSTAPYEEDEKELSILLVRDRDVNVGSREE